MVVPLGTNIAQVSPLSHRRRYIIFRRAAMATKRAPRPSNGARQKQNRHQRGFILLHILDDQFRDSPEEIPSETYQHRPCSRSRYVQHGEPTHIVPACSEHQGRDRAQSIQEPKSKHDNYTEAPLSQRPHSLRAPRPRLPCSHERTSFSSADIEPELVASQ